MSKYSTFPLFRSRGSLAKQFWDQILKVGDLVIDATCGNGQDTLYLAKKVLSETSGFCLAIDIQEEALRRTEKQLLEHLSKELMQRVQLQLGSHTSFPKTVHPQSVKLIVYNLGYLPGSDKKVKTEKETTLQSVQEAVLLLQSGGVISLTCYPGHVGGLEEQETLLNWTKKLNPQEWSVSHHTFLNRKEAPSLLLIQRAESSV